MLLISRILELPKGIIRLVYREIAILQREQTLFYKIPILDCDKLIYLTHKIEVNNEAYVNSTKKNWLNAHAVIPGITDDVKSVSGPDEWGHACDLFANPGRRSQYRQTRK